MSITRDSLPLNAMCKSRRKFNLQYVMFGTIQLHNLQSYIKCLRLPIHIRHFAATNSRKVRK